MTIATKSTIPTLAARLAKVHVLVVDDDSQMLQIVRGLLINLGFEQITTVADGSHAVAMLKDKKLMREREVDLLITDWNMLTVSGLELMKFVRSSPDSPNPYLPIIMVSGRSEWADVERARDVGFSEYLVKPFNAKTLCDRILLCVENPRAFVTSDSYKGPSRRRRDNVLPPGVETDRRVRKSENNIPGKALKGKIGFDINMRQIFTPEHVANAQGYLDSNADAFREWAIRQVGELLHTLRNAQQFNNATRYLDKLKRVAFGIKSQAGMFGYDLGTHVAKSLQIVCEKPLNDAEHELIVIEKHIATLHHIFTNNVRGQGGATGEKLLLSLDDLIQKYKGKSPFSDQPPTQESTF